MLEAAGELIVSRDYASVTLAAIGERAGYSRGLASARFKSKERLIEALVDRIAVRWSHRYVFDRSADKSGLEQVLALPLALAEQSRRDQSGLRVFYALTFEALGPNPTLRERFVELHQEFRIDLHEMIVRGIGDGSIRPNVDPDDETTLFLSVLRGIAYQWALEPEAFDAARAFVLAAQATRGRLSPS